MKHISLESNILKSCKILWISRTEKQYTKQRTKRINNIRQPVRHNCLVEETGHSFQKSISLQIIITIELSEIFSEDGGRRYEGVRVRFFWLFYFMYSQTLQLSTTRPHSQKPSYTRHIIYYH